MNYPSRAVYGPYDTICPCGCARVIRITQQYPRRVYYSDACRSKAQKLRDQQRRDRKATR